MAKKSTPRNEECAESITGHNEGSNRDGRCTWCGVKFTGAAPAPNMRDSRNKTDLGREYRRHYDPDYGTGKDDI